MDRKKGIILFILLLLLFATFLFSCNRTLNILIEGEADASIITPVMVSDSIIEYHLNNR